ncbi:MULTISPECIES: type II secretion system protein GspM [unclassified Lysobacter]
MSTFDKLRHGWQSRELREQRMLAVMFVAIAAFALWFGVVAPLRHVRDAARDRVDRATADLREVTRGVTAIRTLQAQRPAASAPDDFASAILDAAAAAQVPVSRQRIDEAGVLEVGIDAVDAPALLGWLDGLVEQHGIAPMAVDIAERNGRLQVQARFRSPSP